MVLWANDPLPIKHHSIVSESLSDCGKVLRCEECCQAVPEGAPADVIEDFSKEECEGIMDCIECADLSDADTIGPCLNHQ